MNANLLSLAQEALGGDFSKLAGSFLGESQASTQSALGSLLPAVLGSVAQKGATADGASSLLSMINSPKLDANLLGNVAGLFGGGGSGVSELLKLGTSTLVPALFGDKSASLVNALSSAAGIKSSSATNLIAMVVPLVFAFLKKFVGEKGLNASSLSSLLASQGPNLQGALDSRITGALGFPSASAFLGGLGTQAADAARRTGAAVASGASATAHAAANTAAAATAATKSGFMRWLPWLVGLALLWFLWNMFMNKPTPPAPAPAATAPAAPKAMPTTAAPAATGYPFKVYFDVGSFAVGPVSTATITAAAETIKKDGAKVTLTGYTDKTGDVAKNEELAKNRAVAVRDALKAAGVPEGNMELKPPMFVEIGAGGNDAEARRVEVGRP